MKFKYDWSNYPKLKDLFFRVYLNTVTVAKMNKANKLFSEEILSDMEEYFNYLKNNGYDINKIVNKFDSLLFIDSFKKHRVDNGIIYLSQEPVIKTNEVIVLNDHIFGDKRLTERERRRLYLYKGLSKFIFNFSNDKTKEFSSLYSDLFDDKEETQVLVNSGWLLLEETLSQELAERITYDVSQKERPEYRPGIEVMDDYPINGSKVSSRLEAYRPFEELIIKFGGTISGVGSIMDYSETKMMDDLIAKAIKNNLSDAIISEYIFNHNELELYVILYNLGLLINEKYATYGKRIVRNKILELKDVNNIYDKLTNMFDALFNLDQDEYLGIAIKEVNKNIFVKERIKKEIK